MKLGSLVADPFHNRFHHSLLLGSLIVMNLHSTHILATLLSGLLVAGSGLPVFAQVNTQGQTYSQTTPLPAGNGWRPVNPQPVPQEATQFNLQSVLLLRSGEVIPAVSSSGESLYIAPGEVRAASLFLNNALRDAQGNVIVPAGAIVSGEFRPVSGGTQFMAQFLTINNQSYPFSAQSEIIAEQRDPRQVSGGAITEDALIGAAAGALLGGLLGNQVISTEKVLGGAAAGAVIGNVTAPNVAVVNGNMPLTLTVTQDFQPVIP